MILEVVENRGQPTVKVIVIPLFGTFVYPVAPGNRFWTGSLFVFGEVFLSPFFKYQLHKNTEYVRYKYIMYICQIYKINTWQYTHNIIFRIVINNM